MLLQDTITQNYSKYLAFAQRNKLSEDSLHDIIIQVLLKNEHILDISLYIYKAIKWKRDYEPLGGELSDNVMSDEEEYNDFDLREEVYNVINDDEKEYLDVYLNTHSLRKTATHFGVSVRQVQNKINSMQLKYKYQKRELL